jgi:peptide/nickel transport system permease protein
VTAIRASGFDGGQQVLRIFALKLLQTIPVLLLVTLMTTLIISLTPGDPARLIVGDEAPESQVKLVQHQLGLDEPVYERYTDWLSNLLSGNFGKSIITQQSVSEAISERYPVTLEIAFLGLIMALAIAIPSGVYSAYRRGRIFDKTANVTGAVLIASPAFMSGLFLAYFFAVKWRLFPVSGWVPLEDGLADNLEHAFLPAFTLALGLVAIFQRLVRSDMQGILQEEYIAAANARGLSARYILFRHALKPASFSLLTLAGVSLAFLLGGAVIVEQLFALPGLGSLLLQAIQTKDFAMVQGVVLFIASVYVILNALVDTLYAFLDPRVRATV